MAEKIKIVFMGTPEFAVASLEALLENKFEVAAVITAPDKPAGRGLNLQESAVKKYAKEQALKVMQPDSLKDEKFINELKSLNAVIFIVVAFRMLPEIVWKIPRLGTFNLHASLLPQYRGAAPINHAIINGEEETGVTTFFINHEIDKGNILFREKVSIGSNETAGELHDRLMLIGANLVVRTAKSIIDKTFQQTSQEAMQPTPDQTLFPAPKIHKSDCLINWNQPVIKVYHFIRGLSPYPTAYTEFIAPDNTHYPVKIFKATFEESATMVLLPGSIITDCKKTIKISTINGYVIVESLQLSGKKQMSSELFLRGFSLNDEWKALI